MVAFSLMILHSQCCDRHPGTPRTWSKLPGRGMGMSNLEILTRIELPLALPVIVAGLRIATVTVISVAVARRLHRDAGGVRPTHLQRYQQRPCAEVEPGALTACALAVAADLGLARLEGVVRHRTG